MADGTGGGLADRGCPVLVSACLLGVPCTHDGTGRTAEAVVALGRPEGGGLRLIPVCPETAGGLPTPRPPAERVAGHTDVRTEDGVDVSEAYRRGAAHVVALARASGAVVAVLKARSPSCGCGEIYDGSFTRTRVSGDGVAAEALRAAGVRVLSEESAELRRR
jgi:uncharacterized protein YbbK (DUF523 family)